MFDVKIHCSASNAAVKSTCKAAFEREGWSVTTSQPARVHVVIWAEGMLAPSRISADMLDALNESRLLQILVQPDGWTISGPNVIEPPAPFCFFQGLPVCPTDVDGSNQAIDRFWTTSSAGNEVLAEVSRLGDLQRPKDTWNATIAFSTLGVSNAESVVVEEHDGESGRLLRRDHLDRWSQVDTSFRTTMGNEWTVTVDKTAEEVSRITIEDPWVIVTLPQRRAWWRRIGKRGGPPAATVDIMDESEFLEHEPPQPEPQAEPRVDVFISYARADADAASRLDTLCQYEGWKVWWDPRIKLGEDFRPRIDDAIAAAACVIVIWSERSASSSWVRYEVEKALVARKLVEIALSAGFGDNAIQMSELIHVDPAREQLLARIAHIGGLSRPRDTWDATLTVNNFGNRPPSDPIIALEWIPVEDAEESPWIREIEGRRYRLARRERWLEGHSMQFGTTSGNLWILGHEGVKLGRGWLYAKRGNHRVTLPRRDKSAERRARREPYVIPFTYRGSVVELMEYFDYPSAPKLQ